jgi:tRNA threonylcarbamoyl adenosine modification protein (Sua5/YciO/YrdC/YwlC family)
MADLLTFYNSSPNLKLLKQVAAVLNKGGLIIYPTDTVYAMGCLSNQIKALNRLAQIKEVKLEKASFSFILKDFTELTKYTRPISNSNFKILKRCLPGPYTFLLPSVKLSKPFEKKSTIGIRISDHPILLALLDLLEAPLITTSIHDADKIIDYTTDPDEIFENWESKIDLMMDCGFGGNIPSTIVNLCEVEVKIEREGKGDMSLI